jgi:nicotinamide mononucleotide transporter
LEDLLQTASRQDLFEWTGLVTGILYVFLAAKEKAVCWIFGIISCFCIAYKDLTAYRLYADAGLQIFYVAIGFLGLWTWFRVDRDTGRHTPIRRFTARQHAAILVAGTAVSFPFGFLLNHYTDATFSYLDSLTTVFSVIATLMLVRKYLDNWAYWIAIDVVYVYLYIARGGYFFGLLMAIYTVIAIFGLATWSGKWAEAKRT